MSRSSGAPIEMVDHACIKCGCGESLHSRTSERATRARNACSAHPFCEFFECPMKRLPWRTFHDAWGQVWGLRKTEQEARAQTAECEQRLGSGHRTQHWNGRDWDDAPPLPEGGSQ